MKYTQRQWDRTVGAKYQMIVNLTDKAKDYMRQRKTKRLSISKVLVLPVCAGSIQQDKAPTVDNLVIDPVAEMFVMGCTVDYVTELVQSYLK